MCSSLRVNYESDPSIGKTETSHILLAQTSSPIVCIALVQGAPDVQQFPQQGSRPQTAFLLLSPLGSEVKTPGSWHAFTSSPQLGICAHPLLSRWSQTEKTVHLEDYHCFHQKIQKSHLSTVVQSPQMSLKMARALLSQGCLFHPQRIRRSQPDLRTCV